MILLIEWKLERNELQGQARGSSFLFVFDKLIGIIVISYGPSVPFTLLGFPTERHKMLRCYVASSWLR